MRTVSSVSDVPPKPSSLGHPNWRKAGPGLSLSLRRKLFIGLGGHSWR